VCHFLVQDPNFFALLLAIDQEQAAHTQAAENAPQSHCGVQGESGLGLTSRPSSDFRIGGYPDRI